MLLLRGHLLGNMFWPEAVHRVGIGENLLGVCSAPWLSSFQRKSNQNDNGGTRWDPGHIGTGTSHSAAQGEERSPIPAFGTFRLSTLIECVGRRQGLSGPVPNHGEVETAGVSGVVGFWKTRKVV